MDRFSGVLECVNRVLEFEFPTVPAPSSAAGTAHAPSHTARPCPHKEISDEAVRR
jgi:hypothetical protein